MNVTLSNISWFELAMYIIWGIFIFVIIHGFSRLGEDNCMTRRETFKYWYLVWMESEIQRYTIWSVMCFWMISLEKSKDKVLFHRCRHWYGSFLWVSSVKRIKATINLIFELKRQLRTNDPPYSYKQRLREYIGPMLDFTKEILNLTFNGEQWHVCCHTRLYYIMLLAVSPGFVMTTSASFYTVEFSHFTLLPLIWMHKSLFLIEVLYHAVL